MNFLLFVERWQKQINNDYNEIDNRCQQLNENSVYNTFEKIVHELSNVSIERNDATSKFETILDWYSNQLLTKSGLSSQGEGREVAEIISHDFRVENDKMDGLACIRESERGDCTTIRRRTGDKGVKTVSER